MVWSHCLKNSSLRKVITAQVHSKLFKYSQAGCSTVIPKTLMMRAVRQDALGGPETLYVGEVEIPKPSENQVLVKVYGSAINRADTLLCKGSYPGQKKDSAPETLGLEMAGKVHALGSNASKWKIGERVMALLPKGGYAEYVTVNENHVMNVPEGLELSDASGIPEVWLTAYQLLHLVASVKAGDFVLIHGGGSGVGTAATQLVKLAGATPLVTAGSKEKIDKCVELGAKAGFNYKEGEFVDGVKAATNGKGVNIILDCVGGSFWKQNLQALSIEGSWVNYGLLGGGNIEGNLLGGLLAKRGRLLSSTLKARSDDYKAHLISEFSKNALPYFTKPAQVLRENIALKAVIGKVFPLEDVADAHRFMLANKNIGKVVLKISEEK